MRQPKNRKMFLCHLQDNYGKQIRKDLNRLTKDLDVSLTWLGDKYCFTREYARQIFFKYHGYKYSKVRKEKVKATKKRNKAEKLSNFYSVHNPTERIKYLKKEGSTYKGTMGELRVKELCEKQGYKITIDPKRNTTTIDLIINNFLCEVKSSYKSYKYYKYYKNESSLFYRCRLLEKQKALAHFVIWYIAPKDEFYIIPSWAYLNYGYSLYLPESGIENKFTEFKNAWHLLQVGKSSLI